MKLHTCSPTCELARHRPPNARFWYWINGAGDYDCFVKITLKPGQELTYFTGRQTDEGFTSRTIRWEYDEHFGVVFVDDQTHSRDCDGPLHQEWEGVCKVGELQSVPNNFGDEDPSVDRSIKTPKWETVRQGQRDYFAEAAGY